MTYVVLQLNKLQNASFTVKLTVKRVISIKKNFEAKTGQI